MKPVRAEWGRVGPVWGVSGVGHALGVRLGYLATRIGQVGPRGAGPGRGRVGRAEWGWACIGIVRVGVGPSKSRPRGAG